MSVDMRTWNIFNKIAVGAGAVALLFSFFNSYIRVSFMGHSAGVSSAWTSYATLGMLLILAAVVLVVADTMQPAVLPDTAPWPLIIGGASALGTFLVLLRGLTWSDSALGASVGLGWSGWIVIIAGIVLVAATVIPLTSYRSTVENKLNNLGGGSAPDA